MEVDAANIKETNNNTTQQHPSEIKKENIQNPS